MIPTIVKPKLLSLKNRWRGNLDLRSQLGRDAILAFFTIIVMSSIHFGLFAVLTKINQRPEIAFLHPSTILGIILFLLSGLLLFSSLVASLGYLFLGDDLDMIVSSPMSLSRFFVGKLCEVFGNSTWMAIVFGLPAITAFGAFYRPSFLYYLHAAILCIPFFAIPVSISMILVTLMTIALPAQRTKEILAVIGVVSVVFLYCVYKLFAQPENPSNGNINDLLHLLSIMQLPMSSWTPPHWFATYLGEMLLPSGKPLLPYALAVCSLSLACASLAFITLRFFHNTGYSRSRTGATTTVISNSRMANVPFISNTKQWFKARLSPASRAIWSKDTHTFLRDITQAVQLALLLGLCTIYLYNLRMLRIVDQLPPDTRIWWQSILIIGNMAMGGFVTSAVCTRFVFPSVSLEGRSYWVIRTSPLSVKEYLHTKFRFWFFPVATVATVLLTSGALAINAPAHVVIISALSSWILSYGIVGVAIGLGAVYANFNWEHSSQLAASFGSLVFMMISTVMIFLNMFPATFLILLKNWREYNYGLSTSEWLLGISLCLILLGYLNVAFARYALAMGEKSLLEREN